MSQLDRTTESLEDVWISLRTEWQSAQDLWLDATRGDFETAFLIEIEQSIRDTLEDFRAFSESVKSAQQSLEQ